MGPESHCSLLANTNIGKELLPICLRDKAKIVLFSKLSNFYFDLRPPPPPWEDPRARQKSENLTPGAPRTYESPWVPGGWSGFELTDTLYPSLIGILEKFISVSKQSLSMQTIAMYARYPLRFSSIAWKVTQAMLENLRGYLAYINWYGDVPLFWVPSLGCFRIFGYLFRLFPDFCVSFFLVQFDFFRNNPHFWVLILIFYFK